MVDLLPRCVRPCRVPPERYEALRVTVGGPGAEAGLCAPIFACHATPEGGERACAGWLAVAGRDHLGMRLAVASGRLDPTALAPPEEWDLYDSYEEMVDAQVWQEDSL